MNFQWHTSYALLNAGEKGAILHVNRQFIAQNAKDGGRRPVYTLKPNGPNSKPIYARRVLWEGLTEAVAEEEQLACGARAWITIAPGAQIGVLDQMSFEEARNAA